MTTELAVPTNACLDGLHLEVPTREWRILPEHRATVRTLALGDRREQLADPGPGMPYRRIKRRFTLRWPHVGDIRKALEELVAVPGMHDLILWRHEQLAWPADGQRDEFHMPNEWILAVDYMTPPQGLSADRFVPEVKVGRGGAILTYSTVDDTTYAGGTPPAVEVWFNAPDDGSGASCKLPEPPPAGSVVYARVVPVYRVLVAPQQSEKSLTEPIREPAEITLLEV